MKPQSGHGRWPIGVVVAMLVAGGTLAADELIDRVMAVVAGQVISLGDVTAARDLGLISPGDAPDPVRAVLTALIDRELTLAEVERYAPPEPDAEAVDREVAAVRARFPSLQALNVALEQCGFNEAQLREVLLEDLRIRAYLDQRFTLPPPSDDDLDRYYRAHQQAFSRNGQIVPFDAARVDVALAWTADRRKTLIDDWVAGLRRRADIVNLYLAGR